ncbi:hypothetical protein HOD24_04305 [Candidatus Peregrinibacteria bacterium]|jgi:hypothetical protein|nr:hypothetical protein [Candidatus Peregrinibacteria bacterium]
MPEVNNATPLRITDLVRGKLSDESSVEVTDEIKASPELIALAINIIETEMADKTDAARELYKIILGL